VSLVCIKTGLSLADNYCSESRNAATINLHSVRLFVQAFLHLSRDGSQFVPLNSVVSNEIVNKSKYNCWARYDYWCR